jgi:uncharacterized protein YjiK
LIFGHAIKIFLINLNKIRRMTILKILNRTGLWVLALSIVPACNQKGRVLKSPPHYNFSVFDEAKLDIRIKEISGITWDSKADEFITHNDESGKLFFLDKESKEIKREIKFAGKGDYEDIALANGVPYVLRSDGMLTKIVKDSAGTEIGIEAGKIDLTGTNDFEALYYDAGRKALIMVCKNCEMDDKKSISAFAFYPDSGGFDKKPVFTINADEIRSLAPEKSSKFQPSAAAIHPVLKKLFVISSASNQLVIADTNGKVESVFVLAKNLFPQPEGITFKNYGDMYISNEAITTKSTLIKFIYKP